MACIWHGSEDYKKHDGVRCSPMSRRLFSDLEEMIPLAAIKFIHFSEIYSHDSKILSCLTIKSQKDVTQPRHEFHGSARLRHPTASLDICLDALSQGATETRGSGISFLKRGALSSIRPNAPTCKMVVVVARLDKVVNG